MSSKYPFRIMSRRLFLVLLVMVLMLAIAVTVSADGKTGGSSGGNAVGFTPIVGSPLTINVAVDASYQVIHDGVDISTPGQVYPTGQDEADAGLFVWYGNYVLGPDFDNHNTSASNSYDAWANTSQSSVQGTGTGADPWIVETAVENTDSGVTMNVDTIYVNGNDYFRIDWEICVPTAGAASTFLAADFYLQGSDDGFGYYDAATQSVGGFNAAQDWFQIFTPVTPPTAYFAGYYGDVWDRIGDSGAAGTGFDNTIVNTELDNGGGLQWDTTIGGCSEFISFWSFGETPVLPPTSVALSDMTGQSSANSAGLVVGIVGILAISMILVRRRFAKSQV
ncbi:MAG TPA: hypothetical protein VFI27_14365 [candidate division Zixibacteria bacterium]|nr:hypothetical protein [candidate division Zixibacteria bacterium]